MKGKHSPLFVPVLWEGNHFKILDETLLPWKVEYLTIRGVPEALEAVRLMKTRAFGQVLTFVYSAALLAHAHMNESPDSLRQRFERLAEEFAGARPTFDFKGIGRIFSAWLRELPPNADVRSWIEAKAQEWIGTLVQARAERARHAAKLLPNPCRLLTHCNISGELVAVARSCQELGKRISVIATETRPYLQGSRLTAWEVSQAGFEVTVIPDCAVAQILERQEADAVLVGSDRCAQNGDIINKVGTYPIALAAKRYGIPFYAMVQDPRGLARGEDVVIEERPAEELLAFHGQPLIARGSGLSGRYPAFDVTPASLISSLIGFDGAVAPETFRKKFQQISPPGVASQKAPKKYLLAYGIPKSSSYSYLSQALKAEKMESILIPEMRPGLWGAHILGREFLQRNIPATFISDNMMGTFFARGQIRRLILFYNRLSEKGPVGISGGLLAALLAHSHSVPVELMEAAEVEEGSRDRDVSTFMGIKVVPEGAGIHKIAREVIPWSLFAEERAGI